MEIVYYRNFFDSNRLKLTIRLHCVQIFIFSADQNEFNNSKKKKNDLLPLYQRNRLTIFVYMHFYYL